jgi:hypothetical protein
MGHDITINVKGQLNAGVTRDHLVEVWRSLFPSEDLAELDRRTGAFVIEASGEFAEERLAERVGEFERAARALLSGPGAAVIRDYDSPDWCPFAVIGIGRSNEEAVIGEMRARFELAADAILPNLPRDTLIRAMHEVAHGGASRLRMVPSNDYSPALVRVPANVSDEAAARTVNEARLAANIETANGEVGDFWEAFDRQVNQRGLVIVGEVGSIERLEADPWDRDDADAVTPPAPCDDAQEREIDATDEDGPVRERIGDYWVHPRLADELSGETRDAMSGAGAHGSIGPATPCGNDVRAVIDAFNVLADRLSATLVDERVLEDLAASCARTIDTYLFG